MGKCFIVDVRIGIWVTGDQMLFTLSHSPQVQWPSKCVYVCVFPRRCSGCLAQLLSPRPDTNSPTWFNLSAEMKSLVVVCSLWARIRSINLGFERRIAADLPTQPELVEPAGQQFTFCTRLNKWQHMFLCESVNHWPPVHACVPILVRSDKGVSAENVTSEKICIKPQAVSPCRLLDWLMWGGGNVSRLSSFALHEVKDSGGFFSFFFVAETSSVFMTIMMTKSQPGSGHPGLIGSWKNLKRSLNLRK